MTKLRIRWYLHRLMGGGFPWREYRDFMEQDEGNAWIIPCILFGLIAWVVFIDTTCNAIYRMMVTQ